MKKYFVTIVVVAFITACGSNTETVKKEESATPPTAAADLSANPDYQKGLELIGKSDCLTCHKIAEKLIGPAYQDVANKYESTPENITMLAKEIIAGVEGGKGKWGQLPMTAHATLSQTDAEQMVKYVLLLKTN